MSDKTDFFRRLSNYTEGYYELLPISGKHLSEPSYFPLIQKLNVDINVHQLLQDYKSLHESLSNRYIEERQHHLLYPIRDVYNALNEVGFSESTYEAFGMMNLGTTHLLNSIPDYTRNLLSHFQPYCRAHYAVAHPGFKIKTHTDSLDFSTHGFRVHIPITCNAYISFQINNNIESFVLSPGYAWFVNNCLPHFAYNDENTSRVSILLQATSEDNLLKLF